MVVFSAAMPRNAALRRDDPGTEVALDRHSPLPLYQQIKRHLVRMAEERRGAPGRFHSESELTRLFGVSRMTVRQAIQELVDEGILRRRRGAGTFVTLPKVEERFGPAGELPDRWATDLGEMRIEPLAFDIRPCPAEFAVPLAVEPGAPIRYIARLRLAGSVPVAVDHRYIPPELADGMGRGIVAKSILLQLWDRLELSHGEIELDAVTAAAQEARWLGVSEGAALIRRRVRYLASDGRAVMTGVSLYPADLVRYSVHVPLSRNFRSTLEPFTHAEEAPREARLRRQIGPRAL
jgi:GntR family transcriptional regulator, N-acetylglucosamine utilization regulator